MGSQQRQASLQELSESTVKEIVHGAKSGEIVRRVLVCSRPRDCGRQGLPIVRVDGGAQHATAVACGTASAGLARATTEGAAKAVCKSEEAWPTKRRRKREAARV